MAYQNIGTIMKNTKSVQKCLSAPARKIDHFVF